MTSAFRKYFGQKYLLLFSPVLLFVIFRFIVGFNGLYGQDSHEYFRYSRAIVEFFKTGNSPGDYFWPIYYPVLGAILGLVMDNLFSLQLISALSLTGCLFFIHHIINNIYEDKKYLMIYLVISFLFAPYVLRNSFVVMADMLTVFCITASFYFFIGYLEKNELKNIIFFSGFSVIAVLTRYAAAAVFIIPFFILLYEITRKKKFIHMIVSVVIAIILITPHILIRKSNSIDFLEHTWLQRWSVLNYFKSDFITPDGTEHFRLINIINSFSIIFYPTYLVFGIVVSFFLQKKYFKNKYWMISLGVILVYAFFLAGIPYQNQRFFLLFYPFVVVVLYPAFERLMFFLGKKRTVKYLVIGLMLIVQIFFCIYFFRSAYERNVIEKEISAYAKNDIHKNIYSFDVDVSFISYDVNKNVINMRNNRIAKFEPNSIVIFNEEKFKIQWANMNPMLNWIELKSNYDLLEVNDFGDGWKAYEIR